MFKKSKLKNYLSSKNLIKAGDFFTYASINKSVDRYWANPKVDALNNDWVLALVDEGIRTLYILRIEKNSLNINDLLLRKNGLIDLRIKVYDGVLKDSRSKIDLSSYLVTEINY